MTGAGFVGELSIVNCLPDVMEWAVIDWKNR